MSASILAAGGSRRAASGLCRLFGRLGAALARELRLQRDIRFLMEQDDRMLHDLGLTRSDVERVVRGWLP